MTTDAPASEAPSHDAEREAYAAWLARSPQASLYCEPWWLDVVAPGRWRILTVEKGGKLQAAWPVVFDRPHAPKAVVMPPLTQKLGMLLPDMQQKKQAEVLSEQHRLMDRLIEQLPAVKRFNQRFHENLTNWLPFYWRGYQQTTRYTYLVQPLGDENERWEAMRTTARTEVRKAQKAGLTVTTDMAPDAFWPLHEQVFDRQGRAAPFSRDFLRRIDQAVTTHAERVIFAAYDPEGRPHAAVYLVLHRDTAYYLLSGSDPSLRSSGATYLLLWEAMRYASERVRRFDFEGSMIQPIEAAFRAMGARQTPYFQITRAEPGLADRARQTLSRAKELARRLSR